MIEQITVSLKHTRRQFDVVGLQRVNLFSGKFIPVTKQAIDNICAVAQLHIQVSDIYGLNFPPLERRYDVIVMHDVECGCHYAEYLKTIKAIDKHSKRYGSQFFITTQSLEFIKAAHGYFMDSEHYDFAYYRIGWSKKRQEYSAVVYDQETLEGAKDLNFEVR